MDHPVEYQHQIRVKFHWARNRFESLKPAADPACRDLHADPDADAADDVRHVPPNRPPADAGLAARSRQPGRAAAPHHPPPAAVLAGTANHTGKHPKKNYRVAHLLANLRLPGLLANLSWVAVEPGMG